MGSCEGGYSLEYEQVPSLKASPTQAVIFCCGMTLQAVDAVGEILLSLSYLPTAERLTVVVAKCKNLVWTNGKTTAGQR